MTKKIFKLWCEVHRLRKQKKKLEQKLAVTESYLLNAQKGKEEAELHWDIDFENEKQRDDYDLSCSCGSLYHFEDENEVNSFVESNFYCSVCGRKWRIKL